MSRPGARAALAAGWWAAVAAAVGVRLWNALAGPTGWGYDAWGHLAYALYLDLYRGVPWADQGWSYFHPPLHYALGLALAQLGSAEALMRGLALLGGAASLGVAALAARLVRAASPGRPALALLAFASLALLPVHLYVSPMPGNKMTETLLSSAAVAAFVAGERRPRPGPWRDAWVGLLLGLALLTAFSGLLALAAICAALCVAPLLARERAIVPALGRCTLIGGVALLVASPYYARNLATFGTPFRKSSDFPSVQQVESRQPPGARGWRDYVALSPRMLREPDPRAPHLIHSIWGSAYVGIWADVYRQSEVEPTAALRRRELRWFSRMALLGLAPTLLALAGAALALRDAAAGRRRAVYLPLLALGAANGVAFAAYASWVPRWPAIKAYYLLGASLPYAVFLARGAESLWERASPWPRRAAVAAVAAAAAGAAVVGSEGAVLPPRGDSPASAAVHFHFADYDAARRIYGRMATGAPYPVPWLENLAAVELAQGRAATSARLYARAVELAAAHGRDDPYRRGRLAVATALAGDPRAALDALDAALRAGPRPELLANRGAIRARLGEWERAADDLRAAVASEAHMLPALLNRAAVLERLGRGEEARAVRARAAGAACRPPRRYPYGLGSGEVVEWGIGRRWLLLLEEGGLRVALPAFYRDACRALRGAADGRPAP